VGKVTLCIVETGVVVLAIDLSNNMAFMICWLALVSGKKLVYSFS